MFCHLNIQVEFIRNIVQRQYFWIVICWKNIILFIFLFDNFSLIFNVNAIMFFKFLLIDWFESFFMKFINTYKCHQYLFNLRNIFSIQYQMIFNLYFVYSKIYLTFCWFVHQTFFLLFCNIDCENKFVYLLIYNTDIHI